VIAFLEEEIAAYDKRLLEVSDPFADLLQLMDGPGIGRRTAENLLAEVSPC